VKTKGQQPKPRWGHSAVLVTSPLHRQQGGGGGGRGNHDDVDGEATMWVFGGFTTTGVDNDLFCFHFRTPLAPPPASAPTHISFIKTVVVGRGTCREQDMGAS
jgi:hypothetical protein